MRNNIMPTAKKREKVRDLNKLFTSSSVLIFTDYRGLSVSEITNLRRQLRDKGVEYHVAKNTLSTLAANRSGMESMAPMLDGPTAIAFVGDDIAGAAKVLSDFVRTSRILQIRGGLAGRTVLNEYEVGDLTKILPREQYIAKVLGSMNSPVSSMVNVLSGTIRSFMNVMQARVDQMKEQGDATGTAATAADAPAADTLGDTSTDSSGDTPADADGATEATMAAGTDQMPAEASIADESGASAGAETSIAEAGPGTGDAPEGDAAAADIEGGAGDGASSETESLEG
ncbi:MAG TPA: 50S ribosomal protein L10 [Chloroflexia bacterium]|nr:50S ribosomal protein L10 [Chloroflexia bacterium]